ncbi:MAG: hypothetical protein ACK5T7_00980, partial [Gemmatimonas sp.]
FLESIEALSVSVLPGYPDYYLDRPGAKPQGSRALDHDLFALGELGEWAAKISAIEEPKPLMLRETPLGGATAMPPLEVLGERMPAIDDTLGRGEDPNRHESRLPHDHEPLVRPAKAGSLMPYQRRRLRHVGAPSSFSMRRA